MTHPLFAGIGGHQSSRSKTDEWLTPPSIISALGGADSFDLDPAAPVVRPWPTARHHYSIYDNGLALPWTIEECECHLQKEHQIQGSNDQGSSSPIEMGSEMVKGGASAAVRPSQQICRTSAGRGNISQAGAENVSGLSRENQCDQRDLILKNRGSSENKNSHILDPRRADQSAVRDLFSRTIDGDNASSNAPFSGLQMIGIGAKNGGENALTAEEMVPLSKSTSSQYRLTATRGRCRGTCCRPARDAIDQRELEIPTIGARTPEDLVGSFHTCGISECRARSRKARVFLNPPYSTPLLRRFMARMAAHDCGIALIFARTETDAFFRFVWERASAALFLQGRLCFHHVTGEVARTKRGAPANAGGPSVLCAYGRADADVLAASGLEGHFVPISLPRAIVVSALDQTWVAALSDWLRHETGPVRLSELYRAFARHPKAVQNQNFKAKIRQVLQEGPFRRVDRGVWEYAGK